MYILFLAKLKGKRKVFFEWKSIHLSYELSLSCGVNVHHTIPTRENREHPGNFQNKSRRGPHCEITPNCTWLS